jgi:chromosome segregation ATPase
MRLEDSLNQTVATNNQTRKPTPAESKPAPASTPRQDTVTISPAARQASLAQIKAQAMKEQEKAQTGDSQALKDYKKWLDNKLGRNENVPASKEEKIKKLREEIEKLRAQLERVTSDPKIPESVKKEQIEIINAQIQKLEGEIAKLVAELEMETVMAGGLG